MKIETKLALNNINKNRKRTFYTTFSLVLCSTLILTTILLISSIKNGVSENFDTEYNDYHIILKDIAVEQFNKIKNKKFIEKIYIQKDEYEALEKVDSSYVPKDSVTVYLKYNNIKKVCLYTNDIIKDLNLTEPEIMSLNNACKFNKKLLTINGIIDVYISEGITKCRVNYSYIIDLIAVIIIIAFSIFFIIILYNAFFITINERKKEYATLNSIGGTEGQVLKMVFIEAIFVGIIGLIVGGGLSLLLSKIILNNINAIMNRAGYYFRLVFDIKYITISVFIIAINIYLSALIPSLKASSTSVIEGIKNNKGIKNKKRNAILELVLPIEGKVAIKNIKRNKCKYNLIMFLLIISITSFISASTYLEYEKETKDIVVEYDVDATLSLFEGVCNTYDYKPILKEYEERYNKKIDYIEYRIIRNNVFEVEPESVFLYDKQYLKNTTSLHIIALDDISYKKYLDKLNIPYGNLIIYNNTCDRIFDIATGDVSYIYAKEFKENVDFKIRLIEYYKGGYYIIFKDTDFLNKKIVLTDELIDGYKEVKTFACPTLFIDMKTYNEMDTYIEKNYGNYMDRYEKNEGYLWDNRFAFEVKIKCDDIVEFKSFLDTVNEKRNLGILANYHTLENEEKIIYIHIIELILRVLLIVIITIGIVSTVNIMNASLIERKEDFNILYRMGATKGNVKKILIYECIYVFVKAVIISIILSIPIISKIIKSMKKVLTLDKLLIPFNSIVIFITVMFVISLAITIWSTKMIKEE